MNKQEILDGIKILSKTQGFYSNILNQINNNPEQGDKFLSELEKESIKDIVDLVIRLETQI